MTSSIRTSQIAILVSVCGSLAFIFGVIAENKKPASGTPIQGEGAVICKFPSDPSILLGCFSIVTLAITSVLGVFSIFHSYQGKKVPTDELFKSATLRIFFAIAIGTTVLAEVMILWATITEGLIITQNIQDDSTCSTTKTGVFGGGAFLALDATLFWLICLMLTVNARADYFDDEEEDSHGRYGKILIATECDARGASPAVA